jgi:uncharacterized membrane protein
MAPNIGALLCYLPCCLGLIVAVVAAIIEKQSRLVRFHAFQSLLLHAAMFVLFVALTVVQIGLAFVGGGVIALLLWPLRLLIGLGVLALLIICMMKANSGQEYELPVIGEMARKWAQGA